MQQLNSVDDERDAADKYKAWEAMRELMPHFLSTSRDRGPFKLICDDFGPANMLVNNAEDLEIVAVIDWEWCYAGPVELMWSAPRWLLIQSPNMWEDASILDRYNRYLEIYIQQVKGQERELLGSCHPTAELPSTYLQRSQDNGSAWFYQIMREPFNSPSSVPFQQLQSHIPDLSHVIHEIPHEKVESFVQLKLEHLKRYDDRLREKQQWLERIRNGDESLPDIDQILGVREGHN